MVPRADRPAPAGGGAVRADAVVVRDPDSPDNAYYSPDSGDLHFGMFGDRSSARDASVVVHELGHAVSDAICGLGRSFARDTEARGLSEGFSDYFAASLLDDPRLGPFIADDPEGARNAADPSLRFPPDYRGEEHDLGAVWAAVLWGLRGRAGRADTDRLVVESLDFLGPASTFEEARTALHTVDEPPLRRPTRRGDRRGVRRPRARRLTGLWSGICGSRSTSAAACSGSTGACSSATARSR